MLPLDYSRCYDGAQHCPRAETCARTRWPGDAVRLVVAPLWAQWGRECAEYIPIAEAAE